MNICHWDSSLNGWLHYVFSKENIPTLRPNGRGRLWYLVLTSSWSSWERGRSHCETWSKSSPKKSTRGKIPMPEWKLGLFQKFAWGRKDLALNYRLNLFLLRVKDCHDSTPFLYHMRCSTPLLGYFPKKEGNLPQEGLYHIHYYHFYYFGDLVLDLNLFLYHETCLSYLLSQLSDPDLY